MLRWSPESLIASLLLHLSLHIPSCRLSSFLFSNLLLSISPARDKYVHILFIFHDDLFIRARSRRNLIFFATNNSSWRLDKWILLFVFSLEFQQEIYSGSARMNFPKMKVVRVETFLKSKISIFLMIRKLQKAFMQQIFLKNAKNFLQSFTFWVFQTKQKFLMEFHSNLSA